MSKDISLNYNNGKSDKLPIKQFSLKMFCANPSIVMIAKRGSGKSWVIRAVLHHYKHIPAGIIISKTEKMDPFYSKFFPDSYIYYGYKSEIVKKVLIRQKMMADKLERGKKIDPRCYIIMDDVLGEKKKWNNDELVHELLFDGRHYKVTYILALQYPLGMSPDLRSNFDYIFLLATDNVGNMKRMYENYAGMIPNFDSFRQIYKQLTSNHGCMVIANRGAEDSFFSKIYHYTAPDLTDSKITFGCKQFRDYHNNNYNKQWSKKVQKLDVDEYMIKKKKDRSNIVVDKIITEPN
jgi:hypothetical protein